MSGFDNDAPLMGDVVEYNTKGLFDGWRGGGMALGARRVGYSNIKSNSIDIKRDPKKKKKMAV